MGPTPGTGNGQFLRLCASVCGRDNLRDSSTSTLTLEAAFERLVKTLLTFFSNLAVSVNLQSRAFSNDLEILGWPEDTLGVHASHGQNGELTIPSFSLCSVSNLSKSPPYNPFRDASRSTVLSPISTRAPCEFSLFLSRRYYGYNVTVSAVRSSCGN